MRQRLLNAFLAAAGPGGNAAPCGERPELRRAAGGGGGSAQRVPHPRVCDPLQRCDTEPTSLAQFGFFFVSFVFIFFPGGFDQHVRYRQRALALL